MSNRKKDSDMVVIDVPTDSENKGQEPEVPRSPRILTIIPRQGQLIMDAMNGDIDEFAKSEREGRGGKKFTYVPHGYVTDQLNVVFGPFWSWERMPQENGKLYNIVEYSQTVRNQRTQMDEEKTVKEVAVIGRLTIEIFDEHGQQIAVITRTGSGAKVWEKNTTFADAEQSADSDALKRAAFRLGRKFGLQLYYDDTERRAEWQERFNPKSKPAPTTLSQLLARLQEMNISDEMWRTVTGVDISEVTQAKIVDLWQILEKKLSENN